MLPRPTALLVAVLGLLSTASELAAQGRDSRQLTIAAGALSFDASGTGSSYTVAVRMGQAIGRRWG